MFGAPAYFAKHGRPRHPDELAQHHCILRITDDPDVERWTFRVGGRRKNIRVRGRFRTDGAAATHAAVAGGLELGLAPLWQIRGLVDDGAVEIILEDFETANLPIHGGVATRKGTPGEDQIVHAIFGGAAKESAPIDATRNAPDPSRTDLWKEWRPGVDETDNYVSAGAL